MAAERLPGLLQELAQSLPQDGTLVTHNQVGIYSKASSNRTLKHVLHP